MSRRTEQRRAAVWALLQAGASEVRVWNRSPQRARALGASLGATATERVAAADILVNCTAVGLDGGDPFGALPLTADRLSDYGCVVDLVYTASGTRLIDAARARGVDAVDGLQILVGQGALSFERFTGVSAPVATMLAAATGHP